MSPRSEEFIGGAREALAVAHLALREHHYAAAASHAYYAMLYAARAALSERDLYAKTHRGTWSLFYDAFVKAGPVGAEWPKRVQETRELREHGDYEAKTPSKDAAADAVEWAEEFVALIEQLFGSSQT